MQSTDLESASMRRCVNRTCGRYMNRVEGDRQCVSCGRSTKPTLIAPLIALFRRVR